MTLSVSSPAQMINLALARMGYQLRVGSLYDGSTAAKKALDVYAQTRDAVLRELAPDFSKRIVAATLSGNAAPAPWTIEYAYPADCLRLLNVFNAAYTGALNNPLPVLWTVGDSATGAKVIWTNAAGATLVYTAQVTDPAKWEASFIEELAAALARRLAPVLASPELLKAEAEDEKVAADIAAEIVG